MNETRKNTYRALTETAILLALATVLSLLKLFELPNGGSATPASMLPVIIVGIRWGKKWGFGAAIVYSFLQFFTGFYAISPMALVLDYLVAFGVLGFSGFFYGKKYGLILAAPICGTLRFVVHWISGVVVWGSTLPADMPLWQGSLIYNATYMVPEIIVTTVAAALIYAPLKKYWHLPV
ncbi:energy-coupled thiamine transporter ThiT [Papillibacter cinnamivorans]|uniref:Thiamine transporter n=1 Tax=Papillibacter cinnamivorans DSM 12816 TaxID=1122930 RepID=A0A1W2A5D5_9FIRM|nr:ECF transporter S component [Papillibacter cinnamivorans]SMC55887.1 thiamine transporter [Papillibacter cinnamivorans DSM 12816]